MESSYFKLTSSGDLELIGHWTLSNYSDLLQSKKQIYKQSKKIGNVNLKGLEQVDTSGAFALIEILGHKSMAAILDVPDAIPQKFHELINTVFLAMPEESSPKPKKKQLVLDSLEKVGRITCHFIERTSNWFAFLGQVVEVFFRILLKPRHWRWTSIVAGIDSNGLRAVPIVMLLNFMVGAVVAFLGATVLKTFGATTYTIHFVVVSFFREFGALLTAILIAGRSASAFTAQIGSMKVNEEVDAIKVNGVNPINILVLPRIWSLLVSMPILTFFAVMAGLMGGLAVCTLMLNISPTYFFDVIHNNIAIRHFWVGISKAPIFALVIAVTGCLEGFQVSGSAESVGRHTTSSVVQSIFLVIMIDALAAIFFMEMGW